MSERHFVPRPRQEEILRYVGGKMGVSAVPGSGKTHILSYLAARLVATSIDEDQEVLIVTMVNSAVDNFASRIAGFVQREAGLLPNIGYRVRTLHGLAHDIVRERPGLVGLSEDFSIIDERESVRILTDIVRDWVDNHPEMLDIYLNEEVEENQRRWIARNHWPELIQEVALAFIKRAKDLRITPQALRAALSGSESLFPLAQMGLEIYELYQRALMYRGAVDFDDLILFALQALETDHDLLERLQHRWPFILEDEAQDSSQLQQEILGLLAGPEGNWVRVGDPNQAIHTTFTTANPQLLRDFMAAADVRAITMPNSGRSTQEIIDLANFLVDWTGGEHPSPAARDAFQPQHIEPAPPGDPQPNPSNEGRYVYLSPAKYSPDAELTAVVDSLARWLPEHAEETVAVLVPRNERGFQVADLLRRRHIPYVELLHSTTSTRQVAEILARIMDYLANPNVNMKLASAFEAWRWRDVDEPDLTARNRLLSKWLSKTRQVEDFLWPRLDRDILAELDGVLSTEEMDIHAVRELMITFRTLMRRWQEAADLPVDQLVLTLAQDLFTDPANLALAHKLATVLRQKSDDNPTWRLPELSGEMLVIASRQSKLFGFDKADTGFEPPPGVVTIATMHRAKGLEWDRVYLHSVNNYDFPSEMPNDNYIAEKWFIRNSLNVQAEALAQLEALADPYLGYEEGRATLQARHDYVKERLRLFYVGITRARKDLIITWNTGKSKVPCQPAVPLIALQVYRDKPAADSEPAAGYREGAK